MQPAWRSTPRVLLALVLMVASVGVGIVLLRMRADAPAGEQGAYTPQPPFTHAMPLERFSEHGVTVAIALEYDHAGQTLLAATYTTEQPHYHLYSSDLPREGIDGAGRPTLLEIVAAMGVEPIGPAVADRTVEQVRIVGFDEPFPMYPAGPLTLRLPIALTRTGQDATAELAITYMACWTGKRCLAPVVGRPVTVHIPATPPHTQRR